MEAKINKLYQTSNVRLFSRSSCGQFSGQHNFYTIDFTILCSSRFFPLSVEMTLVSSSQFYHLLDNHHVVPVKLKIPHKGLEWFNDGGRDVRLLHSLQKYIPRILEVTCDCILCVLNYC